MSEIRFRRYPHQARILKCGKKHLAIMGGVGSGKSRTAMQVVMDTALRYKTQVGAMRRTATESKKMLRGDIVESFEPFIDTASAELIRLINGSQIHITHGYDDERGVGHLDGFNWSSAWISQAEQVPYETYSKCLARIRNKNAPIQNIVVEGNPNGKDWIWEEFCKGKQPKTVEMETQSGFSYSWTEWEGADSLCISVPTYDFHWLPKGYTETQKRNKSQRWIDRYVLGKFDTYSGIVYDCFSESVHVTKHFDVRQGLDKDRYAIVAGIDWGFRNPTAVLFAVYDRVDDEYYFFKEYYESGKTVHEVGEWLRKCGIVPDFATIDPSTFAVDPRGGDSIADILIKATGWNIESADNSADGREEVYRHLAEKRIVFSDSMEKTLWEMTHYTYGDDLDKPTRRDPREEPLKKNDHAMDALKYILAMKWMYRNRPSELVIRRK